MVRLPSELVAKLRPFYEGRAVCVTGGAGFVGGHVVDALHALGARVSVIDDLSNASLAHLAGLIEIEPDRVRFTHGSVLEDEALAQAMAGAKTCLHLAAVGSVQRSIESPERAFAVNATGTLRVLEAARRAGAQRVVLSSSSSVYGRAPGLPKVEGMRPEPISPYAASKLAAEGLCTAWASSYAIDTVSLRYFNVFGPRQRADSSYAAVVPSFVRRLLRGERPIIYGDGQQSRDFTYVANVVSGTLLAGAQRGPLAGEVFNLGAGRRTTVLELAHLLAELAVEDDGAVAAEPEHRPARGGDVAHSLAEISRATEVLGYTPLVSLRQGLSETLAWFRSTASAGAQGGGGGA